MDQVIQVYENIYVLETSGDFFDAQVDLSET